MINKKMVAMLSSLNNISDSVIVDGSNKYTYVTDIHKGIIAQIDRTKLDVADFESFGIKSLKQFTQLFNTMSNDGELNYSIKDGVLMMKSPNMYFEYYVHNPDKLKDFMVDGKLTSKILSVPHMLSFTLEQSVIKQITDISKLFSLENIIISSNEKGGLSLKVTQIARNSTSINHSTKHALDITIPGVCYDLEEEFILSADKLTKIPQGEYQVVVHYVKEHGIKSMVMTPKNNDALTLFLASTNIKRK